MAWGSRSATYDNDGDPDLFLNNFGPNVLYRNLGDGTFQDVSGEAGMPGATQVGAGASFFDMDGDGDLDLYAANYVDFHYDNHIVRRIGAISSIRDRKTIIPSPTISLNIGDGSSTDVSGPSGNRRRGRERGWARSVSTTTTMEIPMCFVCNDADRNFLFRNDGPGRFTEVGVAAGVAYDLQGKDTRTWGSTAATTITMAA